jgi:hypothetical protein
LYFTFLVTDSDRITDPTGDLSQRVHVVRVWRARARAAPGRRGSRGAAWHDEGGEAARVWGAVESPGSLREAGNN